MNQIFRHTRGRTKIINNFGVGTKRSTMLKQTLQAKKSEIVNRFKLGLVLEVIANQQ
jgi:hypothetical protein